MKCPPCDKIHCAPRSAAKLECKGGATTGVCGCCPICARVDGEKCGGYYNYLGKCDKGLYCEPLVIKHKKNRDHHKSRTQDGVCKRDAPSLDIIQAPPGLCRACALRDVSTIFNVYFFHVTPVHVKDQPPEQRRSCRPKCTPEFCTKHPRGICSAVDVAEFLQPCQTKCQHTSCSACKFVQQPSCRKCGRDDFRCMRKYGKCIRKDTCSRRKFPCKEKYFEDWTKQNGKFQCFVPEC